MSWCQKLGRLELKSRYWTVSESGCWRDQHSMSVCLCTGLSALIHVPLGQNQHKEKWNETTQDMLSAFESFCTDVDGH